MLRLALAAYRLARAVGVGGAYAELVVACRGITAGSGSATTELRVLLWQMMVTLARYWPMVDACLYVDDLAMAQAKDVESDDALARAAGFVI